MQKPLRVVYALLFSLVTCPLLAQVYGTIYDQSTGDPLIAASVLVDGTTIGTVTELDGSYRLTTVPEGEQTITFSYIGYESFTATVTVISGNRLELDARLKPAGFTGEVVVVTGQRQGQNAAINQQVNSNTIVNVVSQDRIRELPDENAAESVGRLPGVSVQRSGGEGQRVNIRGLSPKFSAVALNGVTIPPTGQGGRGLFNVFVPGGGGTVSPNVDDRSVDLSMIGSESLAGIEVYKSMRPDLDGDAIGGRVNFLTAKAPRTPKYFVTALGGYNSYHETWDNYKLNFNVSRRFLDNDFGLLLGGGYSRIDRSSDQSAANYVFQNETVLNGISLNDFSVDRERYNATAVLDYQLGNGHELLLSGLYGRTEVETVQRGVNLQTRLNGGSIYAGTNSGNIDLANVSLTGRHPFGKLDFSWKATYVRTRDLSNQGFSYGFGDNNPYDGQVIPQDDAFAAVRLYRYDPTQLSGGAPGGGGFTERSDANYVGSMDVQRDFRLDGIKTSGYLKGGIKLQSKDRTRMTLETTGLTDSPQFRFAYMDAFPERQEVREGPAGAPFIETGNDLSGFFDGEFPILLSLDPTQAEGLFRQFENLRRPFINPGVNDYLAEERIYAAYLMVDFNISKRLNILGGVRYEQVDNNYEANRLVNYSEFIRNDAYTNSGTLEQATSSQDYGELLPMVNLRLNVLQNNDNSNGLDLRFAATRALTRPDFYNLTPFISINNSSRTIQRSEPNLLPTTAWNYDAFLTAYHGKYGLFTLGAFYKTLENIDFLYGRPVPADDLVERFGEEFSNIRRSFTVIEPVNAPETTTLRGLEVELQSNLNWLPSPLDGIVLYGNVTFINSEAKYPVTVADTDPNTFITTFRDTIRSGPMPGQSDITANLSLGYDKGRFSGRISYNLQGNSLAVVGVNEELDIYTDDYVRVDASAKFRVTDNVFLIANANNLLNRRDASFVGVDRLTGDASIFGTVYWLGIRYSGSGRERDSR